MSDQRKHAAHPTWVEGEPPPAIAETLADISQPTDDGAAPQGDRPLVLRDPARYHIEGVQGHGGIGWVLRARDLELGRVLALKELINRSEAAEARFEREIRLTARLEHPSIVPVHDAGRWATDGRSFYTMKLVAGATLKDTVERTRSLEERLALVPHLLAIAEALAYAHSRGIIHRDLKPANVVLGEYGETMVIDWGLAKELDVPEPPAVDEPTPAVDDLTVAGTVMGTPAFMAPEQAAGSTVDVRADVYALGAIAYCVLTGHAPYEASTSAEVLKQLGLGPPSPLRQRERGVPVDLAAIVEKAMARDPEARYPSARELALDLRRYQAGRFVVARQYAWWEPSARWLRRHVVVTALTAAFLIVGAVAGVVTLGREQGLRQVAERERGRAEAQTLSLLEQQARGELDAGRPRRAAIYLADALLRAPDSRVLRTLLSQATDPSRAHVRALLGHERDVVSTAFSPDGAWLATGSTDTTVRLWSVASTEPPRILRGHERGIETVAWSADGARLASVDGKTFRIWRTADGTELYRWPGRAAGLAFSPDGTELWTGDQNGGFRILEVATGREVLVSKPHSDRVWRIVFAPDGTRGYTVSWDGLLIEWDTATHREIRRIDDHRAPGRFLSFSADGRLALSGDEDGTIHVRDGVTFEVLHTLHLPAASHAVRGWFAPDGRTLVTASADGGLRVWHATSGVVLLTIDTVAEGKLFDATQSPEGLVAIASLRSVDLWRPNDGTDLRVFGGGDHTLSSLHPGVLSADGRHLVATRIPRLGPAWIQVWDTTTGEVTTRWEERGTPFSLGISAEGGRVVVGDLAAPPVPVRDGRTGALVGELSGHTRMVYNLAQSADGLTIATASYDETVRQWNAETLAPIGPVMTFELRPTAVAFHPSAPRLAIAFEDGSVAIHDREDGTRIGGFPAHLTWIQDIEFSPDGLRLVTAGRQDHTAKIWDPADEDAAPIVLSGHADNLMRAVFSPDGTQIATASMDDTARLWDSATGELLRTIDGATYTVAFSPDGGTLYTTGVRDYVVAWGLKVEQRDPEVLAAEVRAASPWQLDEGRLVLRAR